MAHQNRIEPFDAEALFAEVSETGVPGNDLFLDHVRFTFGARYRLASELASRLAWELDTGAADAEVPPQEDVSGQLLYSPWGKRFELDSIVHEQLVQPFLRQATHVETVERLREEWEACDRRLKEMPGNMAHAIFARRQEQWTADPWLSARSAFYLMQTGDAERAEQAAEAALGLWPHRYDARSMLAFVRAMRGTGLAEGLAILDPDGERKGYFDVQYSISTAKKLAGAGEHAKAEPWLRHALERDPYNSDASIELAQSLYRQQRADEAVEALKEALARTPDNPLLWDELSVLYCLIGEWSLSDEALERSERLAPYRFHRLFRRAEALSRIRQYRRALNPIVRYLEAVPEDPEAIALHELLLSKLPKQEPADPSPVERKRMPWE